MSINKYTFEIDGDTFECVPLPYRYEKCSQWIIFDDRLIHCLTQLGNKIVSVSLNEYNRQDCMKIVASTKFLPGIQKL